MENYEDPAEGYKTPRKMLELAAFVIDKTDVWRDHRRANFENQWDEYERMWRGIWSGEDKSRQTERARMVTPAIQHVIDSRRTEIEEAIFGQNLWFDIDDDDQNPADVAKLKQELMIDFKRDKVKKIISQINTNAEVYGTGIAEIVVSEEPLLQPAQAPTQIEGMQAIGVTESTRKSVKPYPVHPRNFLIDPNAKDIEDSLGCAVEEYVSLHTLIKRMEDGTYNKCPISEGVFETDKEPVTQDSPFTRDKAIVIRYYGFVPREYLEESEEQEDQEKDSMYGEFDDYADMVEAVVIICNGHVLKATANPYMLKDRPIVVYRPEIIPGRFWGRGTCEKGYNSQKAIDSQIRAHLDHTAITAAPMIASDITRMPRGFKFDITPGRNIGVQGPPNEILMPITMGASSPINVETAKIFESFLAKATGVMDPGSAGVSNQTDPAVMSMQLAGLLKKHKHALMNFQEDFLIPMVQKCAWRYMQFDPDRYPVQDFSFQPTGTLGMMAREYEQQQLAGILKTLGPNSPIVPMLLAGIVENSNIANKQSILEQLQQLAQKQPSPQEQQMQQLQLQAAQAQLQKVQAEAAKAQADAQLSMAKAQALPMEVQAKVAGALSQNIGQNNQGNEFEQRLKLMQEQSKRMDLQLKAQDIQSNERIAQMQTQVKSRGDQQKMMVDLVKARQGKR